MMRKENIIVTLIFLSFIFIITGCGNPSIPNNKTEIEKTEVVENKVHRVTVDGVEQLVLSGEQAAMPHLEREEYRLIGFECNGKPYDWSLPVTSDLIITSVWEKVITNVVKKNVIDVNLAVGNARSHWTASYQYKGITFKIKVTDNELVTSYSDKGMNDNVELVLQTVDSIKYDPNYTINFLCNARGDYWIRKATSASAFGEDGGVNVFAQKGDNFDFSFEVIEDGYEVEVFFAWEILNSNYADGFGNVRFIPSMRDSYGSVSYWNYYDDNSCAWGKPYTFIVVDKENDMIKREYKPTDINKAFEESELYNGVNLTDNMAILDGYGAGLTARLEVGSMLFSDRTYGLNPNALCDDLLGKTYLYDSIEGTYGKVKEAGYVLLIVPAVNYTELCDEIELAGFTRIGNIDRAIATAVVEGVLIETVCYYVKWCEVGEVINYPKYNIVVFDTLPEVEMDKPWLTETATFHTDFTGHELLDRHWQGCPTIARTAGGRLFASWVTGGNNEPQADNYDPIVYSDDNGLTWNNLWWIDNENLNSGTNDTQFWIDPDGRLWMFYTQRRVNTGFDKNAGVWAVVIDNPDMPINEMLALELRPRRLFDGLLRNNILVLSDGTWLAGPNDFVDENNTIVYASTDKGETWEVRGGAYAPIATNFDETILYEMQDGSIRMLIRNTSGKIVECYSYDKGYTWSDASQTELNNPSSRFNLLRLPSGNILLINNNNSSNRNMLTAYLSLDDGKTWSYKMLIDSTWTTYPDIEFNPDTNEIYVIYDQYRTDRGNIHMAVFTEEYLKSHSVIEEDKIMHVACTYRESLVDVEGTYLGDSVWFEKSNGWNLENDHGDNPVAVQMGAGVQYISFKNDLVDDFYVETKIHAHSIVDRDGYPKFGLVLRTATDKQIFYYINGEAWFEGTKAWHVGYVEDYNWGSEVEVPVSIDYQNDYATLGLLREGNSFSFYANGVCVMNGVSLADISQCEQVEIQFVTFNTRVTYKDYFLTTVSEEMTLVKEASSKVETDTLFIGDSFVSLKYWKTFFEDMNGINLGVSGTEVDYWRNKVDYIARYNPEKIVIHIGVNDINRGAKGSVAADKVIALFNAIHVALPDTKILYVSNDPSQNYWHRHEEIDNANAIIKAYVEALDYVTYLDFAQYLYTEDGNYVKTSLEADGLHLNKLGYALWVRKIKDALLSMEGAR